jgi:hypothetical protein
LVVPIAATTGRWLLQEESRVHARSAAVLIFKGLHKVKGRPDSARAPAKTKAGDGYDNSLGSKIIAQSDAPRSLSAIYFSNPRSFSVNNFNYIIDNQYR